MWSFWLNITNQIMVYMSQLEDDLISIICLALYILFYTRPWKSKLMWASVDVWADLTWLNDWVSHIILPSTNTQIQRCSICVCTSHSRNFHSDTCSHGVMMWAHLYKYSLTHLPGQIYKWRLTSSLLSVWELYISKSRTRGILSTLYLRRYELTTWQLIQC